MKTLYSILLVLLCLSGCDSRSGQDGVSGVPEPSITRVIFNATVESTGLIINLREQVPLIPIGIPALDNFTLKLKVENVESSVGKPADMFNEGDEMVFAIHSPVLMFGGSPDSFVGRSCKFIFTRKRTEGGGTILDLRVDDASAREILGREMHETRESENDNPE